MQDDLFEHADAKSERDEALERVEMNSGKWSVAARIRVRGIHPGWTGTGEDLRLRLRRDGLPAPHHHNAWGALINTCVKQEWLVWTGELAQMRTAKSHARATKIYRRTLNG